MRSLLSTLYCIFCLRLLTTQAQPIPQQKPAYFLLAGDSTTAAQSGDGGGWGDGFLNFTLEPPSSGRNYGHNGATTASFRAGGDWAAVMAEVGDRRAEAEVFVTVQFGHNDQKNTSGVSLEAYASNLRAFASEVAAAGAIPILVTPLTRRNYAGDTPPHVVDDLSTQRNITIAAAVATGSRYVDLNAASVRYCDEIGPGAAWGYDLVEGDHTHLDGWGSVVFGRLVSDLMVAAYGDIARVTRGNATLSRKLSEGVPA